MLALLFSRDSLIIRTNKKKIIKNKKLKKEKEEQRSDAKEFNKIKLTDLATDRFFEYILQLYLFDIYLHCGNLSNFGGG